jgi:carboxyl-terminal processing protease
MKLILNPKQVRLAALIVFLGGFVGVSSCAKKPVVEPPVDPDGEITNADINKWVLDSMGYWYYWNASIPRTVNLNQDPEDFFESLLKRPEDRFSWIQNNEELRNQLSGVIKTTGISVAYYQFSNSPTAYAAIRYVHKNSPAELAGLKRGDILLQVNDQPFNVANGIVTNASILSGSDPYTVTKGVLENGVIRPADKVSLAPVENFQESAIHMDTIITTPMGKKVGYIFYNRFLQNQAQQLVNVFSKFKSAGIDELIIDERYNSGGSVSVAGLLSALIHKGFSINSPFIQYKFNSGLGQFSYTYGQVFGVANQGVVTSLNLGLDRVFILATGSSASASELLINNLRPFMGDNNVIHIGQKTRGKDDASITISNSHKAFSGDKDWGIQPIVLKYTNRDGIGEFVNGLTPLYEVSEGFPFAPMGSFEDPLVGKALSIIDPSMQALYGLKMSTKALAKEEMRVNELESFNRDLTHPRPLDVTEMLKGRPSLKLQ